MHNLTKIYSALLDFLGLSDIQRTQSLKRIFVRDIEENEYLIFKTKRVHPIKGEEPQMQNTFTHLTTHSIDVREENGNTYKKRVYENERSVRLHWVCPHIQEGISDALEVFSVDDGDKIRTYIYNRVQRYVVILEPRKNGQTYFLITAYILESRNVLKIENKMKRKLPNIH
jgi:hypothetical protein